MPQQVYIDTNFFLRLVLDDTTLQYQEVQHFFENIVNDPTITAHSSTIVFFEIFWVLHTQISKPKIITTLQTILEIEPIHFQEKTILFQALQFLKKYPSLGLEDCYHLAYCQHTGVKTLKSFDKKLQSIMKKVIEKKG